MANVLVFRTNINTDERVHRAACRLCKLMGRSGVPMGAVCRWSIDLDDCDYVLRIETESLTEFHIIQLLTKAGLQCDILT